MKNRDVASQEVVPLLFFPLKIRTDIVGCPPVARPKLTSPQKQ